MYRYMISSLTVCLFSVIYHFSHLRVLMNHCKHQCLKITVMCYFLWFFWEAGDPSAGLSWAHSCSYRAPAPGLGLGGPRCSQSCWLTRKTHRTQESCYGYRYGLLWWKDADQNQQRQKAHGTKSNRNESQASKYLLSVQSPGDMLNSPSSDVWRHVQSTANQESSPNLSVLGLYCSTHATDLGYSAPQRSNSYSRVQSLRHT